MTKLSLCVLLSILLSALSTAQNSPNDAVLHLTSTCLSVATITPATYLEAPLINGKPDLAHATVYNLKINVDTNCPTAAIKIVKPPVTK